MHRSFKLGPLAASSPLVRVTIAFPEADETRLLGAVDSDVIQGVLVTLAVELEKLQPSGRVVRDTYPSGPFHVEEGHFSADIPKEPTAKEKALGIIEEAGLRVVPPIDYHTTTTFQVTGDDLGPVHRFLGTPVAEKQLAHS